MSLPYLGDVLEGWLSNETIYKVVQTIDDRGNVKNMATPMIRMMMIQPMSAEELNQIPQESRSDSWWTLYIQESDLSLEMDDVIQTNYAGTMRLYQIKKRTNWGRCGYCEYSCVEYEGQPAEVSTND
ncbi:hypothetical protein NO1_1196 [Candidatus Termititenax aidoneus]|uniref:Uncharacterized protein n=1 Tax=Termititenax aidoneus TaxID=2218524 RepID=A0A388TBK2_TERA1|nr:hypothetical protein NO1_1196 [Candidatus Termititenax aidoneus]